MKIKCFLIVYFFLTSFSYAEEYRLVSPSGKIECNILVDEGINYTIVVNGEELISSSGIALITDGSCSPGISPKVTDTKSTSVDEFIFPVVAQKFNKIKDNYNTLSLLFKDDYQLEFRAYEERSATNEWLSVGKSIDEKCNR